MTEAARRTASFRLRPADLDALRATAAGATPAATTGEVLAAIIAGSVLRLVEQVPLLPLAIDNEAVHQARVATRRLRSDLRTFRPLFDESWAEGLRAELSWLGELLGGARDSDVLFDRMIAELAEIDGPAEGRREVLRVLAARRAATREGMLAGIATARFAALLRLAVEAARAPVLSGPADEPAIESLPGSARRPWKKLAAAVDLLGENPSDDDLHAVRIAAKRARYAAEAVEPVVGLPARRYASAIARVQGALGDYHDSVVAREWLTGILESLKRGGAFFAGALAEKERARGATALSEWEKAWQKASGRKLRAWMQVD